MSLKVRKVFRASSYGPSFELNQLPVEDKMFVGSSYAKFQPASRIKWCIPGKISSNTPGLFMLQLLELDTITDK